MQDPFLSADVGYSADHSFINRGLAYQYPFTISALAAAGVYNVSFTTPAAGSDKRYIHTRPLVMSSSANAVRYKIYEAVAFTSGAPLAPINMNRNSSKKPPFLIYTGTTAAVTGTVAVNASAGGNFANQPAGDGIEVLSDNAADVGMTITFYGTKTGATTTVTSETVTLNGATFIPTVLQTWQNLLGAELSAVCAGTVTIREASANATIITIAAGTLSAGVVTPSDTKARGTIVRHDASAASTAPVGIIGTDVFGSAVSSVDALNGTTEEDHNADVFDTVTKVLIGAVASTVNVSILYPARILSTTATGSTGGLPSRSGGSSQGSNFKFVLQPSTSYLMQFTNFGATTATDIDCNLIVVDEGTGV
jgi:hypothetical protein